MIWTHPILTMRDDCGGHKTVYCGCLTLRPVFAWHAHPSPTMWFPFSLLRRQICNTNSCHIRSQCEPQTTRFHEPQERESYFGLYRNDGKWCSLCRVDHKNKIFEFTLLLLTTVDAWCKKLKKKKKLSLSYLDQWSTVVKSSNVN